MPFEQSAWLGLGPVLLAALAIVRTRADQPLRAWLWIGAAALLFALGPHLVVFGYDTGLTLPGAFTRYLPGIANARIPGRAVVLVHLALALFAGWGLAHLLRIGARPAALAAGVGLAVELWVAPIPLTRLTPPSSTAALRAAAPDSAVLALPLGLRDGFGEIGRFDHSSLWGQMLHGRPMTGGFVARLPPRLARAYQDNPVLRLLLDLSRGGPAQGVPRDAVVRELRRLRIAHVMLNRDLATPDLIAFVEQLPCISVVDAVATQTLYRVGPPADAC